MPGTKDRPDPKSKKPSKFMASFRLTMATIEDLDAIAALLDEKLPYRKHDRTSALEHAVAATRGRLSRDGTPNGEGR